MWSSKVNWVRIDCTMCNVCTRSVPYDLQTGIHLHKAATKGRDGGALWRYFTVLVPRVHNPQESATARITSMLCCDGRTSHHVTWFKRLCWQTVQSDQKRVVPKAGLRTALYLSSRVHNPRVCNCLHNLYAVLRRQNFTSRDMVQKVMLANSAK